MILMPGKMENTKFTACILMTIRIPVREKILQEKEKDLSTVSDIMEGILTGFGWKKGKAKQLLS